MNNIEHAYPSSYYKYMACFQINCYTIQNTVDRLQVTVWQSSFKVIPSLTSTLAPETVPADPGVMSELPHAVLPQSSDPSPAEPAEAAGCGCSTGGL